jgi:DNA-directed RNA polymerase specialized sigma subunit
LSDSDYLLSENEINDLVLEHRGWAESIARSVARAWSLDWELDGLNGAAMEALLFCARRFHPNRGVPFRGYSRRRIHEAATEQARVSRGWRRGYSTSTEQQLARDVSSELLLIFPELREGRLPSVEVSAAVYKGDRRSAIRQVLVGAALLASYQKQSSLDSEDVLDLKSTVEIMAALDVVHQQILFAVYWEGKSLRQIATDWAVEGLTVIREHKVLLDYLGKRFSATNTRIQAPKVRPSLRDVADRLEPPGPFADLVDNRFRDV